MAAQEKYLKGKKKQEEKQTKGVEKEAKEAEIIEIFQKGILPWVRLSPHIPGSTARFLYVRRRLSDHEMMRFTADVSTFVDLYPSLPLLHPAVNAMLELFPSPKLTKNRLKETLSYVVDSILTTPEIEEIKEIPSCSNSPDVLCQHYIPLDVEEGPTPCWDQFLARVDLVDEFLAFLWSIYHVEDEGRQLLWVRDPGGGGKTSVAKTLARWLGDACGTFDAATLSNNHGAEGRVGKRLLIDSDSKMYGAVVHEEIHKITGADNITINPKNKKMYQANAYAKVIIMSNYFPKITSSVKNERSRLLMVKLTPRNEDSSVGKDIPWEEGLIVEKKQLLYRAKEAYSRVSKNHEIDSSRVNWVEIESNDLEEFYEFLRKNPDDKIIFHPDLKIPKKDVMPAFISSLRNKVNKNAQAAIESKIDRHIHDKKVAVKREGQGGAIMWYGIGRESGLIKEEEPII
jgi:hypothetical protein